MSAERIGPTLARASTESPVRVLAFMIFAMIFLQKLGVTIGEGSIGLDFFFMWGGLLVLCAKGNMRIVPARLILLVALVAFAAIGTFFGSEGVRLTAAEIFIAMFAGCIFRADISHQEMMSIYGKYQKCMSVIAFIVIFQQITQYTIGSSYWINLDRIIPQGLLYPGFAYIRPYAWNSHFLEPNGIFFLEPSTVSSFLAVAIAIELSVTGRFWRVVLFLIAMLACLAGTGPVCLALTFPLWATRIDKRMLVGIFIASVVLGSLALATGWLDTALGRADELSNSQSSGYARIVLPLLSIRTEIANLNFLAGHGAGMTPRLADFVQWPFSKLLFEYGLATAIAFHFYLLVSVLASPPSRVVIAVVLVPYLFFGGGFVSHSNVMPLVLFGSLLRVDPARQPDQEVPATARGKRLIRQVRRRGIAFAQYRPR